MYSVRENWHVGHRLPRGGGAITDDDESILRPKFSQFDAVNLNLHNSVTHQKPGRRGLHLKSAVLANFYGRNADRICKEGMAFWGYSEHPCHSPPFERQFQFVS